MTPFSQITIVGVGLLGGSLGLAARDRGLARRVVGVGHRESSLRAAQARGAIDRFTLDVADAARNADLLVLATPVGLFADLVARAAPALAPDCLVTDVGSTKRAVLQAVLPRLSHPARFVGSHPIAGSEARGIDAARPDLYSNALTLVVPSDRSDPAAVLAVEQFWQALGARTRRLDAETHDRLLAAASHLPHVVAAALVQALAPDAESVIGKGFLDTTRIASGDPAMWRDILLTNADEILRALDPLEHTLADLRSALTRRDPDALRRFLDSAKTRRDKFLNQH